MTPALRKQLFERWKGLAGRDADTCRTFNYFVNNLNCGKIHLQHDKVQSTFFNGWDSFQGALYSLREVRRVFGYRE